MFTQPVKRFVSALLAISLAMMSGLASAETHDVSHAHAHEVTANDVRVTHDHDSHDHDRASESDCGFGECVTCHLFCHASALLPGNTATNERHDANIGFHSRETPLQIGLSDRIERPNW